MCELLRIFDALEQRQFSPWARKGRSPIYGHRLGRIEPPSAFLTNQGTYYSHRLLDTRLSHNQWTILESGVGVSGAQSRMGGYRSQSRCLHA
jgi:hypothetical protein